MQQLRSNYQPCPCTELAIAHSFIPNQLARSVYGVEYMRTGIAISHRVKCHRLTKQAKNELYSCHRSNRLYKSAPRTK